MSERFYQLKTQLLDIDRPSGDGLLHPPALRWTGCTMSSRLSWAGPTGGGSPSNFMGTIF